MLFNASYRVLISLFLAINLHACTHVSKPDEAARDVEDLTQALSGLSAKVLLSDANQTSHLLINTAVKLAADYKMASPALYHNTLVNMGLRERGLCCHWAEDLHAKLRELNISSLKFDWLVARQGSMLREHNTVVIYASNASWEDGIVFDPWRMAGVPFWTKVKGDKYPWQLHPLNGQWEILRCK